MSKLIAVSNNEMRSDELLKIVNAARKQHGERAIRNNDFAARIADELEGEHYESFVVQNKNKTESEVYVLDRDQCLLVSMRESKAVRRNILGKLKLLELKLQQEQVRVANRNAARLEAPELTAALKDMREQDGKETKGFHYSNEYNMINKIVLGFTSKQYAKEHGLKPSDSIRDTMRPVEIEAITALQRANTSLIDMGIEYQERKPMLVELFKRKFEHNLICEIMAIEA